jgi:hypothetical protein
MILGVAVVVAQVSQPVIAKSYEIEQAANDDESSEQSEVAVSADVAITSATGLNLNQESYKIREIILDEVADPHVIHIAQKLTETDHFKTLFRKVISANAP